MMKIIIVALVLIFGLCDGKGVGLGYGHGGYGGPFGYHLGYGFIAKGYGYHRPGIAKVQVHQTPYNYNYALNEHGPGYHKYINQGATFHHGGYGY